MKIESFIKSAERDFSPEAAADVRAWLADSLTLLERRTGIARSDRPVLAAAAPTATGKRSERLRIDAMGDDIAARLAWITGDRRQAARRWLMKLLRLSAACVRERIGR